MPDSDREKSVAVLVGRLIRSYRTDDRRNGRPISQEGLVDLMAEHGEDYAVRWDRSNVSHWETGARLAPREFLEAFGRALDISESEIHLMLALAGHEPPSNDEGREAILAAAHSIETWAESVQRDVRTLMDSMTEPEPSEDAFTVVKRTLRMAALPGLYALAVGFALNAMGLDGTAVLLAYALVAGSIVVGQWALQLLKSPHDTSAQEHIAGLMFISLFITLNSSLLIGAATKADHFGFYTIGALTKTPIPFLLTMLVNLVLSLAATVIFSLLRSRQHASQLGRSAFTRAVFVTLPPLLFVYVNIVIFTNIGAWIYFLIVLGVMFGAFAAILALNEPGLRLEIDGFAIKATVLVIILLCSSGVAGLLLAYLEPDMVMAAANFRIVPLAEVSHAELGYTAEEGARRLRLGMMFMSLVTMFYLAVVVGGYLITTVRHATLSTEREETGPVPVVQERGRNQLY